MDQRAGFGGMFDQHAFRRRSDGQHAFFGLDLDQFLFGVHRGTWGDQPRHDGGFGGGFTELREFDRESHQYLTVSSTAATTSSACGRWAA